MSSTSHRPTSRAFKSLSQDELSLLAEEVFKVAWAAVDTRTKEAFVALERVLKDWEYTALVRSSPAFEEQLTKIEEEIDKDSSQGTEWRTLLGR